MSFDKSFEMFNAQVSCMRADGSFNKRKLAGAIKLAKKRYSERMAAANQESSMFKLRNIARLV